MSCFSVLLSNHSFVNEERIHSVLSKLEVLRIGNDKSDTNCTEGYNQIWDPNEGTPKIGTLSNYSVPKVWKRKYLAHDVYLHVYQCNY